MPTKKESQRIECIVMEYFHLLLNGLAIARDMPTKTENSRN